MSAIPVSQKAQTVSKTSGLESFRIPVWVSVFVLVGGLLLAVGGVIGLVNPSMLVSPHDQISGAVHIYAGYFAVRNLALGLFLPILLALRARRALAGLMVVAGFIQLLDVGMDCIEGRWTIVPGVLVLGALYLIAASRVSGAPFWRRESWA
jgi:hypothetical protein